MNLGQDSQFVGYKNGTTTRAESYRDNSAPGKCVGGKIVLD
jgi:hypothetical protein